MINLLNSYAFVPSTYHLEQLSWCEVFDWYFYETMIGTPIYKWIVCDFILTASCFMTRDNVCEMWVFDMASHLEKVNKILDL